jgi:hypothetical protein
MNITEHTTKTNIERLNLEKTHLPDDLALSDEALQSWNNNDHNYLQIDGMVHALYSNILYFKSHMLQRYSEIPYPYFPRLLFRFTFYVWHFILYLYTKIVNLMAAADNFEA